MTPLAGAVAGVLARPAPVLVVDTCSLIDLFRRDRHEPKAEPDEVSAAADLLRLATGVPGRLHLIVPELVPREFADNAGQVAREFEAWFTTHDENQFWLVKTAPLVGVALPAPVPVRPFGVQAALRRLADDLLAAAVVLARDQASVDRAVTRLVDKRRPSHKKEMKDSMNLEQTLELARRLRQAGFGRAVLFISSNTNDFADPNNAAALHPDLAPEFAAAGLEYRTSLRAAVRPLQAAGQLP